MKTARINQKTRLFNYLAKNKTVTTAQAQARLQIANPSAVVAHMRNDGVSIRTTVRFNKEGNKVFEYRLGSTK